LEAREASLRAENANYAKALAARQQHAREKAQEAVLLGAALEVERFFLASCNFLLRHFYLLHGFALEQACE
jgi:hypothetical protein